jgi:carbonic anhydrase
VVARRSFLIRSAFAIFLTAFTMALAANARAQQCPTEPDWSYTGDDGPSNWNELFPIMCGQGVLQSPIDIQTTKGNLISASLPKLVFKFNKGHITFLDHDDQIQISHGEGNFITIGGVEYDLINVHVHTTSEHTIDGNSYPLEIHYVLQSPTSGLIAVVGVLVKVGKSDSGVITPPNEADPATVDLDLTKLIPKDTKSYVRYTGSLTTPGSTTALPRCQEGILWTVMLKPITMSQNQIDDFQNSEVGCWSTETTNRPTQPIGNRPILSNK